MEPSITNCTITVPHQEFGGGTSAKSNFNESSITIQKENAVPKLAGNLNRSATSTARLLPLHVTGSVVSDNRAGENSAPLQAEAIVQLQTVDSERPLRERWPSELHMANILRKRVGRQIRNERRPISKKVLEEFQDRLAYVERCFTDIDETQIDCELSIVYKELENSLAQAGCSAAEAEQLGIVWAQGLEKKFNEFASQSARLNSSEKTMLINELSNIFSFKVAVSIEHILERIKYLAENDNIEVLRPLERARKACNQIQLVSAFDKLIAYYEHRFEPLNAAYERAVRQSQNLSDIDEYPAVLRLQQALLLLSTEGSSAEKRINGQRALELLTTPIKGRKKLATEYFTVQTYLEAEEGRELKALLNIKEEIQWLTQHVTSGANPFTVLR